MKPPLIPGPQLTVREVECIHWAALGKTTAETAREIQVSERTVEFHLANAVRKLGAPNKLRAVVIALQQTLIDP
jgi:LuxR family transcriptional regulator of spore coat protein